MGNVLRHEVESPRSLRPFHRREARPARSHHERFSVRLENHWRRALSYDFNRPAIASTAQSEKPARQPRTRRLLDLSIWRRTRLCHHARPRPEDRSIAGLSPTSRQRAALGLRQTGRQRQTRRRIRREGNAMSRPTLTAVERRKLLARLFPEGIPVLWCPLITHYDRDGAIDGQRLAAHLRHLSPYVKGFLVPGSTGDGWEMGEQETRQVLEVALEQIGRLNLHSLIGVLKTDGEEARLAIRQTMDWLNSRAGAIDDETGLRKSHACGFTVCPPRGKELTQQQIGAALGSVLEFGLPTALYQLPQITQNEIHPELA